MEYLFSRKLCILWDPCDASQRVQHQKGLLHDASSSAIRMRKPAGRRGSPGAGAEGFECPRARAQGIPRSFRALSYRMRVWSRDAPAGLATTSSWPAARHFDQRRLACSAQADAGDDRRDRRNKLGDAGPRAEIDDAYVGGERTGEGAGCGRRGHTPFIMAVETSSDDGHYMPAGRWSRGFRAAKPSACAPPSRPEQSSSATAATGFVAFRSSRALSMSATSPARTARLHATPPSAGRIPCSPT